MPIWTLGFANAECSIAQQQALGFATIAALNKLIYVGNLGVCNLQPGGYFFSLQPGGDVLP